jgi:hypothetical protein
MTERKGSGGGRKEGRKEGRHVTPGTPKRQIFLLQRRNWLVSPERNCTGDLDHPFWK